VNQRFVDRFWPGQDAVGRTVRTARRDYTVIGVVPTGKYVRLGEDPAAFMWFAQSQLWSAGMAVMIRTTGDPNAFVGTLRSEAAALDANLPVSNIRSMEKHLGISLLPARLTGAALGVFGVLGLLLASVGMYGVMAYSVAQRTREIGIRMAIGAAAADVIRLVMRQGLTLVLIGTVVGLGGAFAASRLLASVLYGGNSLDPMTFTLVPLVLIAVAAVASYVPARRAAAVDPAITLRSE
jgi:predicted lysophospholipase L1 biosynthesis ABC-type transport system permease subunit